MNDRISNLVSYLFIIVFMIIFSSIGLGGFRWDKETDTLDSISFNYDENFKLSTDARVALHELIKTNTFAIGRVGVAGKFSKSFDNFSILLHEDNALSAFKKIIEQGTTEAKVYAILGIKFLNEKLYTKFEPQILQSKKKFTIHGGCTYTKSLTYSEHELSHIKQWFGVSAEKRYNDLKKAGMKHRKHHNLPTI